MLETHRRLYNAALAQRRDAWQAEQRSVSYVDQSKWFTVQRLTNNWFQRLNFSSAQTTLWRLDKTYKAFFRRKYGYPRFKAGDRFGSFTFSSYGDGVKLRKSGKLYVQHVGELRIKLHRPIQGEIKTVTLISKVGKWYVVFSCDATTPIVVNTLPPVGIDLGIETFLTTSDSESIDNPRFLRTQQAELRRRQRALARKHKGGTNRRKARRHVAVLHAKIRNRRGDFHHKVALDLLRSYGLIAVEDLNVRGMLKNHRLARAISEVGWTNFVNILRYKAESAGAEVVVVNARGTSQECSGCGQIAHKSLSVRWHECPHCGLSLHRDVNAAKNILVRALQARMGPVGANDGIAVVA